jgi:cytochrome b561
MDQLKRLSKVTVSLHWIVGIMMICLYCVGFYIAEYDAVELIPLHKSFGLLIIPFVLVRVIWRIKSGWPQAVSQYAKIEQVLAKIVHWALISLTVLMPASGFIFSGASGHGVAFFGIQLVPENPSLVKLGEVVPFNKLVAQFGHEAHEILGTVLLIAIILHVAGALKHHILDKDGTLKRMLGKEVE